MKEEEIDRVKEPDMEYGNYSYADYITWEMDEIVELIKGKVFRRAAAAPGMSHQQVSIRLSSALFTFLKGKSCQVFPAPFDVRLPGKSEENDKVTTVVQPDICVVCDETKLSESGCLGAPDLVVEILSRGNNKRDLKDKFEAYQIAEVKEYWIIHPIEQTLLINTLVNGSYRASRFFVTGDMVRSSAIEGFELDLAEIFDA